MTTQILRSLFTVAFLASVFSTKSIADTGWLDPYAKFWNGTSDSYYTLLNTAVGTPPRINTSAPLIGSFNGADLGDFTVNSYTLFMNAEISAWADGGDTFTNFSLWYRVFSGTPTGSFTQASTTLLSTISGNDRRGEVSGIDLSGRAVGNYTIEAYISRSHTWTGGGPYTTYLTRTGDTGGNVPTTNLFTASFDVIPEPSSASLLVFGTAALLALRRRKT